MKTRLFPGIAFRDVGWQRRAWVIGTALDVWEIVAAYQDFGSVDDMATQTDLPAWRHGWAWPFSPPRAL